MGWTEIWERNEKVVPPTTDLTKAVLHELETVDFPGNVEATLLRRHHQVRQPWPAEVENMKFLVPFEQIFRHSL